MISTITHAVSEDGFSYFLDNGSILPSRYFKTISTSIDGSFNNIAYRPFIIEMETSVVERLNGKPIFYLPTNEGEVYKDKYGIFKMQFFWEWEIFFTNEIPDYYISSIYVVSIDGEMNEKMKNLIKRYENEYGNISIIEYDYSEREDYWGFSKAYRYKKDIENILKFNRLDWNDIKYDKEIFNEVWEMIDEINNISSDITNTDDIYYEIKKKYLNEENDNERFFRLFRNRFL